MDRKPREECRDCRHWSRGAGVSWLGGIPDWCGEYAEPMRGDEPACAAFEKEDRPDAD